MWTARDGRHDQANSSWSHLCFFRHNPRLADREFAMPVVSQSWAKTDRPKFYYIYSLSNFELRKANHSFLLLKWFNIHSQIHFIYCIPSMAKSVLKICPIHLVILLITVSNMAFVDVYVWVKFYSRMLVIWCISQVGWKVFRLE